MSRLGDSPGWPYSEQRKNRGYRLMALTLDLFR